MDKKPTEEGCHCVETNMISVEGATMWNLEWWVIEKNVVSLLEARGECFLWDNCWEWECLGRALPEEGGLQFASARPDLALYESQICVIPLRVF